MLVVPLSSHPDFIPIVRKVSQGLRKLGISCGIDNLSASIGKRYARNDEAGVPFGITVDFNTVKDGTVTLRGRNSTKQVRSSKSDVLSAVKSLVYGEESWEDVFERLPEFISCLNLSSRAMRIK